MAIFHNIISIVILQDNYRYKQSWSQIKSFKPGNKSKNTIRFRIVHSHAIFKCSNQWYAQYWTESTIQKQPFKIQVSHVYVQDDITIHKYLTSGAITCSTVVDIKEASCPRKMSWLDWSANVRQLFERITLCNLGRLLKLTLPSSASIFPYVHDTCFFLNYFMWPSSSLQPMKVLLIHYIIVINGRDVRVVTSLW